MIVNDRIRPELFKPGTPAEVNPLVAQLTHGAFPAAAAALRRAVDAISQDWDVAVRQAMPQMQRLTVEELSDSTPEILRAIADALASDDPHIIGGLVGCAPQQGLSRLRLNFDLVEVMQEDRLLRGIVVLHVEAVLDRRMEQSEAAALHAAIDLMLQRSAIALVDEQKLSLRTAAETELKFMSFLAHDMNNNLNNVNLLLGVLADDIEHPDGTGAALASLRLAQQSIEDTVLGMRRMMEHEQLRKAGVSPQLSTVNLHALGGIVARQFAIASAAKGISIINEISDGATMHSNGELILPVLQNFVGNAVKYSRGGIVRIGLDTLRPTRKRHPAGQSLWVSDEGAGIAPEQMSVIFEAFRRGDIHGQSGVGLGLAIASQAAKLLGAKLNVKSEVGFGSTFRMDFAALDSGQVQAAN